MAQSVAQLCFALTELKTPLWEGEQTGSAQWPVVRGTSCLAEQEQQVFPALPVGQFPGQPWGSHSFCSEWLALIHFPDHTEEEPVWEPDFPQSPFSGGIDLGTWALLWS